MVSLAAFDLGRAVELLQEYDPRERVRQGHPPEGEHLVGLCEQLWGEPQGPAENEGHVTLARES